MEVVHGARRRENMPRKRIKNQADTDSAVRRIGLIADAEELGGYAGLLKRASGLRVAACAGFPRDLTPEHATWYDDQRVLLAQGDIDGVVVATSPRRAVGVGAIALEQGVDLWRRPPLGRNFAEAVEVARRLRTAQSGYRLASWWEQVEQPIRALWNAAIDTKVNLISEIWISAVGPDRASWCSTLVEAGGGVLIQNGYAALEALCALRGLPESVFGWIGTCRGGAAGTPRETEDAAAALLRYSEGGSAVLRATWDVPPYQIRAAHYGSGGEVRHDVASATRYDVRGEEVESRALPQAHPEWELHRFVEMIDAPAEEQNSPRCIDRHLMVSAVLETLYLSARTGQPEDPRRLFEVQKWPEPSC